MYWLGVQRKSSTWSNHWRISLEVLMLADVQLDLLRRAGIKGIILDLDNTIISEDDRYLSPYAEDWIAEAKMAEFKFFMLSNSKCHHRVAFWSRRLAIPALSPAQKPLPSAFKQALRHLKLAPKETVVIGDSRHTDMLGAWLVGCHCIQVASLPHPNRWWEKLFGHQVQIPFPSDHALWDAKALNDYQRGSSSTV